jgi:hypothetical protein
MDAVINRVAATIDADFDMSSMECTELDVRLFVCGISKVRDSYSIILECGCHLPALSK